MYQDEFLAEANNFSQSWREEINDMPTTVKEEVTQECGVERENM
jgi:hypothetical protein